MLVDILHLSRSLRRSPVSAAAAILTLSLTLGAGASIFAIVDAVLLTSPPFTNPESLVTVGEVPIEEPTAAPRAVSYAAFDAWRDRATSLAALEGFDRTNLTLTELGAAERLSANDVTPGFLALLGVSPVLGRTFDVDDVGRPVVIISGAFWQRKLASDQAVIGRQIVLGGRTHTIVGVLADEFHFAINPADIWRPLPVTVAEAARTGYRLGVIARLAPDASPSVLATTLDDTNRTFSRASRVVATNIATSIEGGNRRTLGLLSGAAALAMIMAFANLAGLLLVRSIDRRRELAVRSALGAPRSEIATQLLLESMAVVAVGTLGGVLLALWMTPEVGHLTLGRYTGIANRQLAVSWRVIGGVTLVSFTCAVVCGSLSALAAARWNIVDVLRRGSTPSAHERTLRRGFVIAEVALACVLLASMAVFGRTLFIMLAVNPGFDTGGVLSLQVSLPNLSYPTRDRAASFYSTLQNALQQRLGPGAISFVDEIPLTGDRGRRLVTARPTDSGREAVVRTAGPGYFDVMRIPVIAGRPFDQTDSLSTPLRVVISESLADRLFPSEQPIGRQLWFTARAQFAEIVGVVGDVKHRALDEGVLPTVYMSATQVPSASSIVVTRRTRSDADVIAAVREEVARLDGNLPVYNIRSMQEVAAASPGVGPRRLLTAAFTGFALLAVALTMIGLFGVVAHDVACRRGELAVRIAVGANPTRILMGTLRQGALMVGCGLAIGSMLSIWSVRAFSGLVSGWGNSVALSIGVAAAVLMATGTAAVLPVALRAARTDPLTILRGE